MHVAAIYAKGPKWRDGALIEDEISAHKAYQLENYERGKLIMGGPFLDEAVGMAIFEVHSIEEAEIMIEQDPAVSSGVYTAEIHPWRIVLRR
ncbi:hypothetical protein J7M28_00675 [bacterium]|nr:hypothetical protein [bacterium]